MTTRDYGPGQFWHLYNRAIMGQPMFACHDDYVRFLRTIKRNARRYSVVVVAYALMPTHFHLAVKQAGETPLSRFIQTSCNSYAQVMNKLRERHGPFFDGKYGATRIESDAQLLQICRYIHRNPIEAGIVDVADAWQYSNYLEWVQERQGTLVDHDIIESLRMTPERYEHLVHQTDWVG